MEKIIMRAPAKINWTLDILGKREDGYHDISTIMQSVAIYDEIEIGRVTRPGIDLKVSTPDIPGGRANIGYRAAELMLETFEIHGGIHIYIHKNIPAAAGMGGGSSDGAAIMLGIREVYGIDVSLGELMKLGSSIGADVPFCMVGGTALAEGIGDRLTKLLPIDQVWLVIVKPEIHISTAKIYGLVDTKNIVRRSQNQKFINALYGGDMVSVAKYGGNALEEVTARLYPEIYTIKDELISAGAVYALMSGSGSSVFGVFKNREEASLAYKLLKNYHGQVFLTHTIATGPTVWRD